MGPSLTKNVKFDLWEGNPGSIINFKLPVYFVRFFFPKIHFPCLVIMYV